MDTAHNKELSFAWWNTSVSPYGSGAVGKSDLKTVEDVIVRLSHENDVVVLGEFSEEDIIKKLKYDVRLENSIKTFSLVYPKKTPSISRFKNYILYNGDRVKIKWFNPVQCNFTMIDDRSQEGKYRIGQKIRLSSYAMDHSFDLYVIHWRCFDEPESIEIKKDAAKRLVRDICRLSKGGAYGSSPVVILGDFNVEPHHIPISALGGSRSRRYVVERGGFYNPFWKHMHEDVGTLRYQNIRNLKTIMPLFDQILVSRFFLDLPEAEIEENIYDDSFFNPSKSEHRPISLKIKWRSNGG